MAETHITVQLNQTDLGELANVVNGDEESHDLPGHINGQPAIVRFRAEEPDSADEPEFATVVLVYRTHGEAADSVQEKLVDLLPYNDEVMFLSVNDGVTASALELGADPSLWADESVGPDGEFLPRGRCDTCGAPCDEQGCAADRSHEVALDVDETDEGGITPEAQADGHRYVMGNVNAHCPRCATLHFEKTGELITVLTCEFDMSA